ncbi:DUF4190 domain-containing protein [Nocardia abscessus]|uniref:DUF4190 domain-containing protein n=1 Tax=Nocardia abscessus TaxID=120957 RepID=UPI0002D9382C|nr:DUF4190 domain-containing protein [Nocardia abscessus]MCC3327782.1 DUF4190 domain-containing protein [Nocardia abscessus]
MSQYPPPPPGQYPGPYPPPGQYPPPPGGQYAGQPGYWQESPKGRGLAITALVFGILALLFFWTIIGGYVGGVFAVIFGIIAVVKARAGTAGGMGMAIAGVVLGVLGIVGAVLFTIVGYSFFIDSGGKDFVDCVNKAGNDQSKIEQCEREWNQKLQDKYSVTLTPPPAPTPR